MEFKKSVIWAFGLSCMLPFIGRGAEPITLVQDGTVKTVVVTSDDPSRVAVYAAEEFVRHVEMATGKRLDVVAESQVPEGYASRVLIGSTRAATEAGITVDELAHDAFILRTVGNDLYILGRESKSFSPLSRWNNFSGTMYGVTEVLERFLGVRWLWPGALGTYVPKTNTIVVSSINETVKPRFVSRRFRYAGIKRSSGIVFGEKKDNQRYPEEFTRLAFSTKEAAQQYGLALEVYLRRHRVGISESEIWPGHTFGSWWEQYGNEHPEWFSLREDGQRGPLPTAGRARGFTMCVSNPELQHFLADQWDGDCTAPSKGLKLGEADAAGDSFCKCTNCLAWDGLQPDPIPAYAAHYYTPRVVSDRYARFWQEVQRLSLEKRPELKDKVFISLLLYHQNFPAPQRTYDLSSVFAKFVPYGANAGWYPMSDAEDQWNREQWLGWAKTGMRMMFRPNHMNGNYVVPESCTWQIGNFMKFVYENGSMGFDFDSLRPHWGTLGLMLYVQMRLGWDPTLDIATVRAEYFSAFGPAAEIVERYFDYWEDYARNRPHSAINGQPVQTQVENLISPVGGYLAYPEKVYIPADKMLEEAQSAAGKSGNPEFAARVKFLQDALWHARLTTRIYEFLVYEDLTTPGKSSGAAPNDPEQLKKAQEAMRALVEFRQAHQEPYIACYLSAADRESQIGNLFALLPDDSTHAPTNAVAELGLWTFRLDPDNRGLAAGWQKVESGDEWKEISVPSQWAHTWVGRDYYGYGWYKNTFTVEEKWRGKPVLIDFEGVDEQAWVYVNGEAVGEHSVKSENKDIGKLWNEPFTVTIPPKCLKYGGRNLLTVRTHASVGGAGIWRTVRIRTESEND